MRRLLLILLLAFGLVPMAQAHGFSRNGGPSAAQQFQNQSSAQYLARQRAINQPSPAARIQQGQGFTSDNPLPGFKPYRPVPEASRQPFVQEHYRFPGQERSRP